MNIRSKFKQNIAIHSSISKSVFVKILVENKSQEKQLFWPMTLSCKLLFYSKRQDEYIKLKKKQRESKQIKC